MPAAENRAEGGRDLAAEVVAHGLRADQCRRTQRDRQPGPPITRQVGTGQHLFQQPRGGRVVVDSTLNERPFDPDGTVTLRLPPGQYHLYTAIRTPAGVIPDVTALARPMLKLTQDTSLTLDARTGQPMQVEVPRKSARSAAGIVQYERNAPSGRSFTGVIAGPTPRALLHRSARAGGGRCRGDVRSAQPVG